MAAAKKGGAAALAASILEGSSERDLASYVADLDDPAETTATRAARVVEEVIAREPALGAPRIAVLVKLLRSPHARVVQTAANALPELAAVAPAKVAKHMGKLRDAYPEVDKTAQDGIVRTFVTLCTASVAYQKRVIDIFERALGEADPKTLVRWTELVLPALKGEPHAMARAVVEARLPDLPRSEAQKIADFLGIKLRLAR
ncbi:MAG: hypothetical protein PVI30_08950 [Myxococcales bacterium]|jgi:hypothetical protein